MGYSVHDYFNEHILPKLKNITEDESEGNAPLDQFLRIIRSARDGRVDDIWRWLLNCVAPDEDLHSNMERVFYTLTNNSEAQLKKLEYMDSPSTIVSVSYGVKNEED